MCVNVNLFEYSSPSAARLRGCEAARLRGCEAANFARYAVLCQVLLQNFCAVFCENVYCFYRCVSLPSQLQYNLFLCEFQREAACAVYRAKFPAPLATSTECEVPRATLQRARSAKFPAQPCNEHEVRSSPRNLATSTECEVPRAGNDVPVYFHKKPRNL